MGLSIASPADRPRASRSAKPLNRDCLEGVRQGSVRLLDRPSARGVAAMEPVLRRRVSARLGCSRPSQPAIAGDWQASVRRTGLVAGRVHNRPSRSSADHERSSISAVGFGPTLCSCPRRLQRHRRRAFGAGRRPGDFPGDLFNSTGPLDQENSGSCGGRHQRGTHCERPARCRRWRAAGRRSIDGCRG